MRILIGVAIASAVVLTGCNSENTSKDSYFNGAAIVEYTQNSERGTNDYVDIRFYEKGSYKISFSCTPGKVGRTACNPPKEVLKNLETSIGEIVVTQESLPDFLRVTITKDGNSESHDFS